MIFSAERCSLILGLLLIVLTTRYIYTRLLSRCSLPEILPWVGVKDDGYLSRARATFLSFLHTRDLVQEGYSKYSKRNFPFVLPNITTGPEVIIPPSYIDWLLQQPDTVLCQNEVNRQFLQADYTMLHPKVIHDTIHADVLRKELTKQLGEFTGDVIDEIDFAFRRNWGESTTEWNEVTLYDTMLDVIGRVSNRVLVGLPLCRNDDYVDASKHFARLVVVQAVMISFIPETLKPILAPFINFFDYRRYLKAAKHTIPLFKRRLNAPASDDKKKNDYFQWSIDHSHINEDPSERTYDLISKRLAALSFGAIQSSAITLTNLMLDLAASPHLTSYLTTMRNEVVSEVAAEKGVWTKAALIRMVSLDSCLRESMRMWGFVSRGILKEVIAKDGVTLPNGMHLKKGTKVGIHAYPVHHDEDLYPNAYEFNAMRFCTADEERPADDYSEKVADSGKKKGTSLVTTSSHFMAFSHGRHACPGRFFASQQLKLCLAYISLNYDIKPIASRPDNNWFVGSQGPPLDMKISIRRREGTA